MRGKLKGLIYAILVVFLFSQLFISFAQKALATGGLVVQYTSDGTKEIKTVSTDTMEVILTSNFNESGVMSDLICSADVVYTLKPAAKTNYWKITIIGYKNIVIDPRNNGKCAVAEGSFIVINNANQEVGRTGTVAPGDLKYQILVDPESKKATIVVAATGDPAPLDTSLPIIGSLIQAMRMSTNIVDGGPTKVDPVFVGDQGSGLDCSLTGIFSTGTISKIMERVSNCIYEGIIKDAIKWASDKVLEAAGISYDPSKRTGEVRSSEYLAYFRNA